MLKKSKIVSKKVFDEKINIVQQDIIVYDMDLTDNENSSGTAKFFFALRY